jgi:hypothetical protein
MFSFVVMRRMLARICFVVCRLREAYWLLVRYDSTSYGVVLVDRKSHRYEMVNGCYSKAMGLSKKALRGMCIENSVELSSCALMVEIFAKVANGGSVVSEILEMQTSDGPRSARWEFELMGEKIWGRCYFLV